MRDVSGSIRCVRMAVLREDATASYFDASLLSSVIVDIAFSAS